ncbi:MAG TPA: energy transducer TonB, partial [Pirellulales bacterium]|nr:energy transducer TonB [Pirellulales bacterium]
SPASTEQRGAEVDRLPQLVSNPAPYYPPQALAQRRAGRVVLQARVGVDGRVLALSVRESSGMGDLDRAALDAVWHWQFSPALRAGAPVEHEIAVPVRFVLR